MVSSLHKQEVGPSCTAVAYTEGETANARKPKRDEEGWNSRQITGCDKRDFQSDCTSHAERGRRQAKARIQPTCGSQLTQRQLAPLVFRCGRWSECDLCGFDQRGNQRRYISRCDAA